MLQAQENSKSNDSGDPHGVWSSKIFAAICIAVGVSTLALAVCMVFVGGDAAPTSNTGRVEVSRSAGRCDPPTRRYTGRAQGSG